MYNMIQHQVGFYKENFLFDLCRVVELFICFYNSFSL